MLQFFLSYVWQDLLLFLPLFDVLQLLPLLTLALQRLLRRLLPAGLNLPALLQYTQYPYMYARASLFVNIGLLFSCFAPLATLFVCAWLVAVRAVWAHNCEHILQPPQGRNFDSGGAYWPTAMRHQAYALVTSQFVLAAFLALNTMFAPALLIFFGLLPFTFSSAVGLEKRYGPIAADLPLDRCDALDALDARAAAAAASNCGQHASSCGQDASGCGQHASGGDSEGGDGGAAGRAGSARSRSRDALSAEVRALLADAVERYSRSLMAETSGAGLSGEGLTEENWGCPPPSCPVAPLRSGPLPSVGGANAGAVAGMAEGASAGGVGVTVACHAADGDAQR